MSKKSRRPNRRYRHSPQAQVEQNKKELIEAVQHARSVYQQCALLVTSNIKLIQDNNIDCSTDSELEGILTSITNQMKIFGDDIEGYENEVKGLVDKNITSDDFITIGFPLVIQMDGWIERITIVMSTTCKDLEHKVMSLINNNPATTEENA